MLISTIVIKFFNWVCSSFTAMREKCASIELLRWWRGLSSPNSDQASMATEVFITHVPHQFTDLYHEMIRNAHGRIKPTSTLRPAASHCNAKLTTTFQHKNAHAISAKELHEGLKPQMADIHLPPHRKHDLKKPPGHKPSIPRYTLRFPDTVSRIHTLYVGVQCRSQASAVRETTRELEARIQALLDDGNPEAQETFRVTEGFDQPGTRVWVAYFTSSSSRAVHNVLSLHILEGLWRSILSSEARSEIGLWREHFEVPLERLETNFSALEHRPGLAAVKGAERIGHELTGYWGAGRDRIPASAGDMFEPEEGQGEERTVWEGLGEVVAGECWENMCHIRSSRSLLLPLRHASPNDRLRRASFHQPNPSSSHV